MAVPVPLRNDFDAATLRQLTRVSAGWILLGKGG